jgi:23S rRNA (adenine2030-N6)-methyltransferase
VAEAPAKGKVLVLIDPPFERADDYRQIIDTLGGLHRRNRDAAALVWLPLKDLETFDGFLRDLEDEVAAPLLAAETRMRPLSDPLKMNGCALVLLNPPPGFAADLEAICGWVARTLGEGGSSRVYALGA